jgi:hypothetical protein
MSEETSMLVVKRAKTGETIYSTDPMDNKDIENEIKNLKKQFGEKPISISVIKVSGKK